MKLLSNKHMQDNTTGFDWKLIQDMAKCLQRYVTLTQEAEEEEEEEEGSREGTPAREDESYQLEQPLEHEYVKPSLFCACSCFSHGEEWLLVSSSVTMRQHGYMRCSFSLLSTI